MSAGDWLPLAQRVLSCEWADDGWCETHGDPWPCDRAQEAADVLAEELDQPTKEQKMGKTTDDEGGIVRCDCGRAVPCRHCPTTPTQIDPADIRPGDVVRIVREVKVSDVTRHSPTVTIMDDRAAIWTVERATAYLVSRPDPDAEAVEALREASWHLWHDGERADPLPGLPEAGVVLAALREQGWDVVRRAES